MSEGPEYEKKILGLKYNVCLYVYETQTLSSLSTHSIGQRNIIQMRILWWANCGQNISVYSPFEETLCNIRVRARVCFVNWPQLDKTCLRGFQHGETQTSLLIYQD